jgi:hypothetical protein
MLKIDSNLMLFHCSGFLLFLISVYLCSSVDSFFVFGSVAITKKSRRAFHPRVWCWDGNALPRCMTAQPGGMSADILLAHAIAAAKVRRQSP